MPAWTVATGERESIITSAVGERNMQPWVSRAQKWATYQQAKISDTHKKSVRFPDWDVGAPGSSTLYVVGLLISCLHK